MDNTGDLPKLSAAARSGGSVRRDGCLGCRQEIADRIQKNLRRLQLRYVRASRNHLQTRIRQACRQFARHRRRRRLVLFADQHQDRQRELSKLGPEVEQSTMTRP